MFCPTCGQQQISEETRYCSRCGFPLSGVTHLIVNNGDLPQALAPSGKKPDSPRRKGIKQGLFIFLLTFLVVPIIAILTVAANAEPYGVVIAVLLLAVGGLLRMAYAMLFQSDVPYGASLDHGYGNAAQNLFDKKQAAGALPPSQSIPASSYVPPTAGNWRDTNDLTPDSVTDKTTQFLNKK